MAYLKDIDRPCAGCKTERARVELVNEHNVPFGVFCRPCGKERLAKLIREEEIKEVDAP